MNGKRVLGGGIALFVIVGVILYLYTTHETPPPKSPSTTNTNSSNPGILTEVLQLIEEHNMGPGVEWTTPVIDYKFKLRTEGHAIDLQFSGNNGTWLKPVSYPPEGDFLMPPDARPGPVKVKAGKEETRKFRVQLYKRINIMLR